MSLQETREFVARFITGGYTPEEYAVFLRFVKGATEGELIIIADTHEAMQENWVLGEGPSTEWIMQLERRLDVGEEELTGADAEDEVGVAVVRMRPGRRVRRNIWMAAASVVILFSAGGYLYMHQRNDYPKSSAGEIRKEEKLLARSVSNPYGGALKEFVLDDGSKVWLKPGSELKYTAKVTGPERMAKLSGEAFFEVAGSAGNPFRVVTKDAEVDVLGTYFAIMAYDDEPVCRVTLFNGAVKVKSGASAQDMKPGEQAEIAYSSPGVEGIAVRAVDPGFVLAWKDGIYRLDGADLHTIMRAIMRSYDIQVQYQPNMELPKMVDGSLDMKRSLDATLKQLEGAYLDKIHFTYKGKTVIVSSI
jgi:ferric-dicitrate binding protein FerR (iron transport regulator)